MRKNTVVRGLAREIRRHETGPYRPIYYYQGLGDYPSGASVLVENF